MTIRPKGPDGVLARMEELKAKVDARLGTPENRSFEAALSGSISGNEGLSPMNPFGSSVRVHGQVPPDELQALVRQTAQTHGLDPELFRALVEAESNFNPFAVSPKGARGLTQLMPATAASLGVNDPFDAAENLGGGARYLSQLLKEFPQTEHALAAYNAGPSRVRRAGGIPAIAETQGYVAKIMRRMAELKAGNP